jgi:hypothetical protein
LKSAGSISRTPAASCVLLLDESHSRIPHIWQQIINRIYFDAINE